MPVIPTKKSYRIQLIADSAGKGRLCHVRPHRSELIATQRENGEWGTATKVTLLPGDIQL